MKEVSTSGYSTASRMKESNVTKNRQANPVDKLSYLKNCLHVQSEGHKRRLSEVKAQNQRRLNSIRRLLDQASTKSLLFSDNLPATISQARGTRISEPVSPAPEKAMTQQDQNDQLCISRYVPVMSIPKSSNLNQVHLSTKLGGGDTKETEDLMKSTYSNCDRQGRDIGYLENSGINLPIINEFKSNLSGSEKNSNRITFDGIPDRLEATPKLAKKAGHLAITVLKNYYADNGQYLIEQPKNIELHDRIDQLNEAKLVAEELVGSLQEKVEDLRIEIKGLTNERKDTKRRHDEQISACQKKYESQVRGHRERIAELERQLEKNKRSSSRKNSIEKKDETKPSVPMHSRSGSNKNSTQFDQVIPALFSLDRDSHRVDKDGWVSEADKVESNTKHERGDSRDGQELEDSEERIQQLQEQVRELEIELESWRANVEELKEQYTMEKSRRLNVMWSLDAKSRQVKNLLSVEEKHSQLIVKFNHVMMANVMLRNQLEGKTGRTFDSGASMKKALERLDQTKESKFALLKDSNTEILRLRGILKRAVERHSDLKDIVECPVEDFNSAPRLNRVVSPFALGNSDVLLGKDKHARSQTINVNVPSPLLGRTNPANKNMIHTRAQNQRMYRKFDTNSTLSVVNEEVKLGNNEPSRTFREDEDMHYRGKESAEG